MAGLRIQNGEEERMMEREAPVMEGNASADALTAASAELNMQEQQHGAPDGSHTSSSSTTSGDNDVEVSTQVVGPQPMPRWVRCGVDAWNCMDADGFDAP